MTTYTAKDAAGTTQYFNANGAGTVGDPFLQVINIDNNYSSETLTFTAAEVAANTTKSYTITPKSGALQVTNSTDATISINLSIPGVGTPYHGDTFTTITAGSTITIYPYLGTTPGGSAKESAFLRILCERIMIRSSGSATSGSLTVKLYCLL